jgi:hypothetical protein
MGGADCLNPRQIGQPLRDLIVEPRDLMSLTVAGFGQADAKRKQVARIEARVLSRQIHKAAYHES